jgi:hypothetical protein
LQVGQATPMESGLLVLHSGYPEHAMNRPKRPRLMTMGRPHFSQVSSVVSSSTGTTLPSTSLKSFVFLQSG